MRSSDVVSAVERVGGTCLIYEGAVLASRYVPVVPKLPAISDLVWKIRSKSARFWVGTVVCGYLLWHLVEGGPVAEPRS